MAEKAMNPNPTEIRGQLAEIHALLTARQTSVKAPYLAFGPILIGLLAYALGWARAGWLQGVGWFAGGLAAWTVVEYLLHRFSFHSTSSSRFAQPFTSGLHHKHHLEPQSEKYVAAPMQLAIPVFALLFGAFRLATGGWASAALLAAGLSAGFMIYERVHYMSHCLRPKSRIGKFLKKHHLTHHFADSRAYFGVTSPVWDLAFGTLPRRGRAELSSIPK